MVFQKSNNVLHLHKNIISQYEFFQTCFDIDMTESRNSTIELGEDVDEELMTCLIKSFYTGKLVVPDNKISTFLILILLADEYLVKPVIPLLVTELITYMNSSNVLECLDLNLDDDQFSKVRITMQCILQSKFEEVFKEKNSYTNLSIDKWSTALNLLVNKNNVAKVLELVHNWIEYDEKNRSSYCYHLTGIVKQGSLFCPITIEGLKSRILDTVPWSMVPSVINFVEE